MHTHDVSRSSAFTRSSAQDVTATLKPFLVYKRNGLNLQFDFVSGTDFKKDKALTKFAFETSKKTLESKYDESGFGWDDFERKSEMCDQCARFIFVREAGKDSHTTPLGFVQYVTNIPLFMSRNGICV